MTFELPTIYPITDTGISGLSHVEQVTRLIAGGARLIQLRDKSSAPRDFYDEALVATRAAHDSGVKVVINDRVDIALAVGADGVHLGQDDLPPAEARQLLGAGAIIGYSTHSEDQAREAAKLPIDYIGFGPVFPTESKGNADPVVGIKGLRSLSSIVGELRIVAIGGIDASNVASVLEAGADSAAVISAVLKDPTQISEKLAAMLLSV